MSDTEEYEKELGLTIATLPSDASPGQTVKVKLANGVDASYVIPEGAQPGQQLPIRQLAPDVEDLTVELDKSDESSVIGIVIKGINGLPTGPYIVECDPSGQGAKVFQPGDELRAIRGVNKKSSFNENLVGAAHHTASDLIKQAIGKLTIDIKRTKSAPVVPILLNGMLSKRSPKSLVGLHAWQQRYFELSTGRITYYEFVLVTSGVPTPVVVPEEKGTILLSNLAGVREDRTHEKRFDLLMANKRLFQLSAATKVERDTWVKGVQAVLLAALSAQTRGVALEPKAAGEPTPPAVEEVEQSMRDEAEDAPAEPEADLKAMAPMSVKQDDETLFWRL